LHDPENGKKTKYVKSNYFALQRILRSTCLYCLWVCLSCFGIMSQIQIQAWSDSPGGEQSCAPGGGLLSPIALFNW